MVLDPVLRCVICGSASEVLRRLYCGDGYGNGRRRTWSRRKVESGRRVVEGRNGMGGQLWVGGESREVRVEYVNRGMGNG